MDTVAIARLAVHNAVREIRLAELEVMKERVEAIRQAGPVITMDEAEVVLKNPSVSRPARLTACVRAAFDLPGKRITGCFATPSQWVFATA